VSEAERAGVRRLVTGAGAGLAGGIASLVLPAAFLTLARYDPGGFFTFGPTLVTAIGILVLAGGLLFLASLFLYRRGFAALRRVDRRFLTASILCLIGTVGFVLVLLAAIVLVGSASDVVTCAQGRPTQALSCLRSGSALGVWAGIIGIALGWIGGIGIVLGLALAGRHFHHGTLGAGAALYGVLLLVVIAPLLALLRTTADLSLLFLAIPVLAVLAPGLVLLGTVPEIPETAPP